MFSNFLSKIKPLMR